MRKQFFIVWLFCFSLSIYGQKNDLEKQAKIDRVNYLVKSIDSIAREKREGIIEGVVVYSHGLKKNFGWEAYFLNDENEKRPLRIKYNENKPTGLESLSLYYHEGELIYSELIEVVINKKSKPIREIIKRISFEKGEPLNFDDTLLDRDLFYILEKEKELLKSIYYK
ncbi:hypothetical protein LNQ49_15100 [Flavobacterium sp. F-65]|uniref:Outer membrane lipoprotein-sorting protein n=1 Tax=Flavobacterium pisciphilum TaxID=2893755 RepID=A0ABS8MVX6_9FLAO|nr:hypothetical protein [Flavobacterium sp. F-65]MCC9072907.1 hypothetical protein [Flavobacterium sp. F-65]